MAEEFIYRCNKNADSYLMSSFNFINILKKNILYIYIFKKHQME